MKTISIPQHDWDRLTHHKSGKRANPFAKLYLHDYFETEFKLIPDEAKWHIISLRLLAVQKGQRSLPYVPELLRGEMGAMTTPNFEELAEAGYVEISE